MKLLRRIYAFFFIYSILAFLSVAISPAILSPIGVLSLSILPCLIINLLFILYFAFRRRWKWLLLSLSLFLIGHSHVGRTISISFPKKITGNKINVLNSNVRIFNVYQHLRTENNTSSKEMIEWLTNAPSDILILQEFYNSDTSVVWNAYSKISKTFNYAYFEKALDIGLYNDFGQAIFSKYPILQKGKINFDNRTVNQAIFADILLHKDTIRVYNLHLESMKIEERKLFNGNNSEFKEKVKDTFVKLTAGFEHRAHQIEKIYAHIKQCPYPVIIGADMNDTPYSYSYSTLASDYTNAFEKNGNGFGFTFNGKLFFLRIDNLFSSEDFDISNFKVHREIPHSDHFPISGSYTLKK